MSACGACGGTALVVWQRRAKPEELAAIPRAHGGPNQEAVSAVYACGSHAISAELGSLIHQPTCSGPSSAQLPACDCTPEPLPVPTVPEPVPPAMPDGWE